MWTVCSIDIHTNNSMWVYSYRSDMGNGTGRCTFLSGGTVRPASQKRPTDTEVAKHIACGVKDSVEYNDIIYTCGTDLSNTVIAVGAVVVIIGGLYYLKKRRKNK